MLKILRQNKMIWVGIGILGLFGLCALLAPIIAPHDPWEFGTIPFARPGSEHLLGTNDVGQDIFSELLYGARTSLMIGFAAGFLAVVLGTIIGMLAGFKRGILDEILMGMTDVVLVIPSLPLIILISVYLGASTWNIILVIGFIFWPNTARVIRSQVISIRESGYVESARALGAGDLWLMRRHVLPNIIPLVLAKLVLTVAIAMLMEASLSFLGLGNPTSKSWGTMLHYAFERGGFIQELWWWFLPPGIAIALCVLALMLISFSIEEQSDPRLKRMLQR